MPFKLPRMARKEGIERWVVDRYREGIKWLDSPESGGIREIQEKY